jgi:hypothetical protein
MRHADVRQLSPSLCPDGDDRKDGRDNCSYGTNERGQGRGDKGDLLGSPARHPWILGRGEAKARIGIGLKNDIWETSRVPNSGPG